MNFFHRGKEQLYPGSLARVRHPVEHSQVTVVHRQDPIEIFEIRRHHPSCLVVGKIQATPYSTFHRAWIRSLTGMECLGSGGFDHNPVSQVPSLGEAAQNHLGGR